MRATIEIEPRHHARLLEIAASRGEKGLSSIIGEAIESYLRGLEDKESVRQRALMSKGALAGTLAEALRRET